MTCKGQYNPSNGNCQREQKYSGGCGAAGKFTCAPRICSLFLPVFLVQVLSPSLTSLVTLSEGGEGRGGIRKNQVTTSSSSLYFIPYHLTNSFLITHSISQVCKTKSVCETGFYRYLVLTLYFGYNHHVSASEK